MVVALCVWATPASATVATEWDGLIYTGAVKAEDESPITLDGPAEISCGNSTLEGTIESHGSEVPAEVKLSSHTMSECGKDTVSVLKPGTLELTATSESDGTLKSTGTEITLQIHRTILGFPVTTHCIYVTSKTAIGTVVGSNTEEEEGTLDIGPAAIPTSETDGACGSEAELTGSYEITTPETLALDKGYKVTLREKDKAGAALAVKATVTGKSNEGAAKPFEIPHKSGNIKCKTNEFTAEVTQNEFENAKVKMTAFELNGGTKGEKCKTTMTVNGEAIESVVTFLPSQLIIEFGVLYRGRVNKWELKEEHFNAKGTLVMTCFYGPVNTVFSFPYDSALGLKWDEKLTLEKASSSASCDAEVKPIGTFTVETSPGNQPVVVTVK